MQIMNEWSVFRCFEMISQSVTGKQLATAMNSGEGEFVDFTEPVVLEGQVERWLCEIGKMFFLFQIIHNLTFIWEKRLSNTWTCNATYSMSKLKNDSISKWRIIDELKSVKVCKTRNFIP